MKNLPEKELFNGLESRLREYTEDPDDSAWDKIAFALHKSKPDHRGVWFERTADLLVIALLLFLTWNSYDRFNAGNSPAISLANKTVNGSSVETTDDESKMNKISGVSDTLFVKDSQQLRDREDPIVKGQSEATSTQYLNQHLKDMHVYSDAEQNSIAHLKKDSIKQNSEALPGIENELTLSMNESDSVKTNALPLDSVFSTAFVEKKSEKKRNSRKRMQIYFLLTPSLAYQKMTPLTDDEVVVKSIPPESIFSRNRFGISLEAGFQRRVSKKIELYGGISYYQQDQTITYTYQSREKVSVESGDDMSFVVTPGVEQNEFQYGMRNIGASAGMLYLIKGGRLQHKAGIGIQYQKGLVKSSAESIYDNSSSHYLSYQLNYRMEFLITKRMGFFLQPNFTHSFYSKETLRGPFTIKPYRAGIGMGLLYTF